MREAEEGKESERSNVRSAIRARNFLTFPHPASRLPPPASRIPPPASRLPPPASRLPPPLFSQSVYLFEVGSRAGPGPVESVPLTTLTRAATLHQRPNLNRSLEQWQFS